MKKAIIVCLILILIVEVFFTINMNALKEVSGHGILDSTIQNSQGYYDIISSYGDEGFRVYKNIRRVDMVFPLIYGLLLILLLKQVGFKYYWLPLVASLFDISENLLIGRMLNAYPDQLDVGLLLSSLIFIKFSIILVSFVTYLARRRR